MSVLVQSRKHDPAATNGITTPFRSVMVGTPLLDIIGRWTSVADDEHVVVSSAPARAQDNSRNSSSSPAATTTDLVRALDAEEAVSVLSTINNR